MSRVLDKLREVKTNQRFYDDFDSVQTKYSSTSEALGPSHYPMSFMTKLTLEIGTTFFFQEGADDYGEARRVAEKQIAEALYGDVRKGLLDIMKAIYKGDRREALAAVVKVEGMINV